MNTEPIERLDSPVAFVIDDDDVDRDLIARSSKNHGLRSNVYLRRFVPPDVATRASRLHIA